MSKLPTPPPETEPGVLINVDTDDFFAALKDKRRTVQAEYILTEYTPDGPLTTRTTILFPIRAAWDIARLFA